MSKLPSVAGEVCQFVFALAVCFAYQTAVATLRVSNRVRASRSRA